MAESVLIGQPELTVQLYGTRPQDRDAIGADILGKRPKALIIASYFEKHAAEWLGELDIPFVSRLVFHDAFSVGHAAWINELLKKKPHITQVAMPVSELFSKTPEKAEKLFWILEMNTTVEDWEFSFEMGKCDQVIEGIIEAVEVNGTVRSLRGFAGGTRAQNRTNSTAAEAAFLKSEKVRPGIRDLFVEFAKTQ